MAATQVTSQPLAKAKGAGTCTDTPGTGQNLIDFINTTLCNANNTEEAEATASGQETNPLPNPEKCTAPVPAPPTGITTIGVACGNAIAKIVGADPFAEGLGKFTGMEVDLVPLVPGKEMVATIGRTLSTSFSEVSLVKARTDVDPGKIGFATDPLTPNDPDTGLIVIEFSDAFAAVTWDGVAASAFPDAKAAIVTVKFRPTHASAFTETPLVPGQELTVGAATPVETTIKAGVKKTSVNNEPLKGTSSAEATAFDVHALKGVSGGIVLNLSRAKATVQGERLAPAPAPGPLANTGPVSWLRTAGLLALLAAAVLAATGAGKSRRIPLNEV